MAPGMHPEPERLARILLLEDSDIDADLAIAYLRRSGMRFEIERAARRSEFESMLARGARVDLVLADYSLPDFDGLAALRQARARWPDVPFVFLSGVLGEDIATEALRAGATDYVLKRNLPRLPVVVDRALRETRERLERQRAEILFRLAAEAADIGVWELDIASGALWFDNGMRRLFGLGDHAPIPPLPEAAALLVMPEDLERVQQELQDAIDGDGAFEYEHRVRHQGDGQPRWMAVKGRRVAGADGTSSLVGTMRDITEQRRRDEALARATDRLEERVAQRTRELATANAELQAQIEERGRVEATLQQMQRLEAVGQLTSGVAHDFNNLLTVVLSNIRLISLLLTQNGQTPDPRVVQRLDSMRRAAERGGKLTAQLLAFSRRQRLEPMALDLNDVVDGMRDLLQTTMGGTVRLETRLHTPLWHALVDPTQLELIVLNLAINARDAMEVGGTLTVATANATLTEPPARPEEPDPGEYVQLTVADSGSGISHDVLAKVFEPFFTTKEVGKGSGLGLAQVYGFAKQSGGGVRIDTALGRGTAVHVYVPRAHARTVAAMPARPNAAPAPTSPEQGHRVLLVDDDADVREVTCETLTQLGYAVVQAGGGHEALSILQRDRDIDLVLADFAMPGMNGAELRRSLLQQHPGLQMVILTGFADLTSLSDVPPDRVLQKPLYENELAERLRELLRHVPRRHETARPAPSTT